MNIQAADIRQDSPLTSEARRLIDASQTALLAAYPPEEVFSFSPEELARPGTRFYVARIDSRAVGCVAAVAQSGYAEIKRLFVEDGARGTGLSRLLMQRLEQGTRADGFTTLRLETGPKLVAAVGLYRALGYHPRTRYGDYADLASSLFMEKRLTGASAE